MLLSRIIEKITKSSKYNLLLKQIDSENKAIVFGSMGAFSSFLVLALRQSLSDNCVVLLPDEESANNTFEDLKEISKDKNIYFYPAYKRNAWNEVGPHSSLVGQKIEALKSLSNPTGPSVIVTTPGALVEKIISPEKLVNQKIILEAGKEVNFDDFTRLLVYNGFSREERVDRPGEMSVRGGLVDIFLFEEVNPFRIEFFGDQIESIREFDVISQRSLNIVNKLEIIPPGSAGFFGPFEDHPQNSCFHDVTILDHLDCNTLLFSIEKENIEKSFQSFKTDIEERIRSFSEEHHIKDLNFDSYYADFKNIFVLSDYRIVEINPLITMGSKTINFGLLPGQQFSGKFDLFKKELDNILKTEHSNLDVILFSDSDAQTKRLKSILEQEDFQDQLVVETANISGGFYWPNQNLYVFTNRELYSKAKPKVIDKLEARKISLKDYISLNYGDFVVHTDYGIGIYRGLKKITAYGKERECITIEYKDRDNLYVPLEKMDLVQKYSSKEGAVPPLSKLGTTTWEKLKKRTKENALEVAKKLIKLYALRKMDQGFAFSQDTVWQKELEASFPFEETDDQLVAIEEVKTDMEKQQPMDRLVCGDVGFGKTEVAIRAAFKAISDDKQVAVLVPTTILAQQHFATFSDRLRRFPVKIEMLSRFRTPQQQKEIVKKITNGELDLIVGTHRLLSKDIKFKDLGLLVVDEEQKFGVMHKERLRLLKEKVDTLSLSATPIPRTMHMSLMGAKDLSIINTPPVSRIPIKTEVCRFNRDHIREVILQEINRGGQVFFVHNRVQSIYGISSLLRELVPEVSFSVAHGQMGAHELEKVMIKFSRGDVQCLISTMIIESGIDLPRANTLIVNRADRLGLSQLYQLRGRVGRSSQQAFAYLIIPPLRNLTRTAIKRLQSIQELTDFGSGYKVAMRDLEIRGTGNIFGAKQSGFVDALGHDLYIQIINEAIQSMKAEMGIGENNSVDQEPEIESAVEMHEDFYLPDDYISLSAERVEIYKRLINCSDLSQLDSLTNELKDRFGLLPKPAQNLFDYIALKKLAQKTKIEKLSINETSFKGKFVSMFIPKNEEFRLWLGKIVQAGGEQLQLKQEGNELMFEMSMRGKKNVIETAINFLQRIM